jgi:hypothetical protein
MNSLSTKCPVVKGAYKNVMPKGLCNDYITTAEVI